MDKLLLNIKAAGCPNRCFHCHSCGDGRMKALLDVDTVRRTASFFREKLGTDVEVLLLDEQTFHPNFLELVTKLEADGFMKKGASKLLVTNCWGLRHTPGLIDSVKRHYSTVLPTLFGIGETHDLHAGRKGAYLDILEATKACLERGLAVAWHLQWSRRNTGELNALYELGKGLGVENVFISAEYFFSGHFPHVAEEYLPTFDGLEQIKYGVYEYEQGNLKTEAQYLERVQKGETFDVKKASLDELYVDESLNVYPFLHLSEQFFLGNLKEPSDKLVERIKNGADLPGAILKKRRQDFSELVLKHADASPDRLYTPQSLFDRLCLQV